MEFIKAKSILSKVKKGSEWYGVDYNMNLYRGCSHGCIYCDSRSDCYHIDNFDIVRGKFNALSILEQELSKKEKKVSLELAQCLILIIQKSWNMNKLEGL